MTPLPPDAPAWLQALQAEANRTSQAACARLLGVSTATVSLVLKGTYGANPKRIAAKVMQLLVPETIPCPVLGDLERTRCLEEQTRPYFPDPIRAAVYKACQTCPHAKNRKDAQ